MGFKEWYQRMKKDNPEGLKEYRNKKQQRYRAKKKTEKKQKEAKEIEAQFKAGNLNYGIKLEAPKAMSLQEFKNQHPDADFWDYLNYKSSLRKPEVEKIQVQAEKDYDYKREKAEKIYQLIEGHDLPDKVQTGFNFWHSSEERTDLDIATEKENKIKNIIKQFHQKFKL
jgi:hypothetical protein